MSLVNCLLVHRNEHIKKRLILILLVDLAWYLRRCSLDCCGEGFLDFGHIKMRVVLVMEDLVVPQSVPQIRQFRHVAVGVVE